MAKVSLIDIANSGASVEAVIELMAKNIEKRLQALETAGVAEYESKIEQALAAAVENISKFKPTINIPQQRIDIPAPVVNVSPNIQVVEPAEKEKTVRITVERGLSGSIESLTVIKG